MYTILYTPYTIGSTDPGTAPKEGGVRGPVPATAGRGCGDEAGPQPKAAASPMAARSQEQCPRASSYLMDREWGELRHGRWQHRACPRVIRAHRSSSGSAAGARDTGKELCECRQTRWGWWEAGDMGSVTSLSITAGSPCSRDRNPQSMQE